MAARNLSSTFIRSFTGATPFESAELDGLAHRMNVLPLLRTHERDRYFMRKARIFANSLGNKVMFGKRYYESLTETQRMAVVAHEFVHIREGDNKYRVKHVLVPAMAATMATLLVSYLLVGSGLLSFLGALCAWTCSLLFLSWSNAERFREMELRCDRVAASYVDGEALIAALRVSDSMIDKRTRKSVFYRVVAMTYPTLEQREHAIRAVLRTPVL